MVQGGFELKSVKSIWAGKIVIHGFFVVTVVILFFKYIKEVRYIQKDLRGT